jgi:hypothetical protein
MTHKVTYRNIDEYTVDICVVDDHGVHNIGQSLKGPKLKWKLKAFFPVDVADLERIKKIYHGPIEAGRELVKAWEYYRAYELRDTAEFFIGDFFK